MPKVRRKNTRKVESTGKKEPIIEPAPPYVIVVHGPPKVGKSLLIKSLVQQYTKHNLTDHSPITSVVVSEQRRIQFVECPNNINGMIDAAKYADTVIFVIDVSYGFEMETLEFVSLLKIHGMPKVIGVFTHLDCFLNKDVKAEELITARFKKNFMNEIHEEAQIFCLHAPDEYENTYQKLDISKLASFISGMEFHHMSWRTAHPYVLVDRFEDVTPTERLHMDKNCDRDIVLYGYLRGCDIKKEGTKVHIAGVGDFPLAGVTSVAELRSLLHTDVTDLKIDINEHSNLDEETHSKNERIGSYLKFKVCHVPSEMVNNHDPCQPILVVGISRKEQIVEYISARFERHSLHIKSLKTNDPIIVSVGWRRYETRPIYTLEDLREILDFTPEDKPCTGMFWGPFATPGTGVVAVQGLADNKAAFRILATGIVLDYWNTRAPTCNLLRKVHCIHNPLMKASEPRDRVWTVELKESEKSEAHVVWGSRERKIAVGDLRGNMSESLEEKLKLPCQKRKTDEQRRAVIILDELYYGINREFLEAYQKKKEEDIRNNMPHGMVTKFFKRKNGNKAIANW